MTWLTPYVANVLPQFGYVKYNIAIGYDNGHVVNERTEWRDVPTVTEE